MDEDRPADRRARDDHRARIWFAGFGAAASIALVVAYYLPGLGDAVEGGGGGIFLVVSVPGLTLASPFLLLAVLLRVKAVWIVAGALMFWMLGVAAFDVYGDDPNDPSLLVFFGAFWMNLILVILATVVDLAVRGVRRARRSFPAKRSPDEPSEAPEA